MILAVALTLSLSSHAYYKIVFDPWTTGQVSANAGAQKLIENKHNTRLDSISAKQKKIMEYTAAMATIKEVYQMTLQNVEGFGPETAYYREIFSCAADILTDVPVVLKAIAKSPVQNYVLCLNELADVTIETEGLIHDFKTIVNNCKIKFPEGIVKQQIPEGGGRFKMEKNDGYNLLDRYERLTLANNIYSRLLQMKYKMDAMVMMCQYCGWSDAFFALDPESWAAYFTGTNMVTGLINDWNDLSL